jgi:hypothetical protein
VEPALKAARRVDRRALLTEGNKGNKEVNHRILGDDPQQRVLAEVADWFGKVQLFRKQEDERMFRREPTVEDLAIHKSLLQRLTVDGERLLSLIGQIGLPENREGIGPEAVAIELDTLRDTCRGWHDPMPKGQREQLLKEIFPDVA